MEDIEIVICPDCELFYILNKDSNTGEKVYSYVDNKTGVEIRAKKIKENIYQCLECGAVFELDINSFCNTKTILVRPYANLINQFKVRDFFNEFVLSYKTRPTKKQLASYIDYLTGKSDDVSQFINIVLSKNNELEVQQKQ